MAVGKQLLDIVESGKCQGACADTGQFHFVMAFQPIVDIEAKDIYGYEALVRGINGEGAAHVLAGVTEHNRYAFDQACRVKAIATAARLGLRKRLSINFLPNAVYHPEACLRLTLATAEQHHFPTHLITFEFTEDERVLDRDHLRSIIQTYRKHSFITALDDFGAGFAGLSLLADFQPDCIKIDRALISGIDADKSRQAIVAGIIRTVSLMNIFVVAEGVERPEELDFLRSQGVRLFQGYLFAKPAIETLIDPADIPW